MGLSLRSNYTADGFWKFTSSAVFAATVVTTIGQNRTNRSPTTVAALVHSLTPSLILKLAKQW